MYDSTDAREDALDTQWLFSRISSQLRREISWADFVDLPIPYELSLRGKVAIHAEGVQLVCVEDFIELGE